MPEAAAPHSILLSTGRRVVVHEYGDPQGTPLFYYHGWPAAGVQGSLLEEVGRELHVRVLSPDRPGVGQSDLHPNRRLLDWPPLLGEIATALNVQNFHVLGVSGGAPYALASAYGLPERVKAAGVVCGAPPLAGLTSLRGLPLPYRSLLFLHHRAPAVLRVFFHLIRPIMRAPLPSWAMTLAAKSLPPSDAAVMLERGAAAATSVNAFRESWRQSAAGVLADAEIYAAPWGFDLEKIHTPVRLWHGTEDRNFAPHLAESLARRLPNCTYRLVPGAGHYSLPIRHAREIVADLLSASSPPVPVSS